LNVFGVPLVVKAVQHLVDTRKENDRAGEVSP
jgi:hypothetical protein